MDQGLQNQPSAEQTKTARRRRMAALRVWLGFAFLVGLMAILPVLPWLMGIVTDAKHVYTDSVPEENRGAYLQTTNGAMQLYTWRVEPPNFPEDAPTLERASLQSIVVVQKLFDEVDRYRLYNLETNQQVQWVGSSSEAMQLTLAPPDLSPGPYMLVVPTDSMYGGNTWHYFRLQ